MTSPNAATTEQHALSLRAELARQTLRLRAALHEAEEAERAEADMDPVSARTELSARLGQLMEQRRRQLDADLDAERHRSAMTIEAARREAAALVEHAEQEFRHAEAAAAQAAAAAAQAAAADRVAATEAARDERDLGMAAPAGAAPVIVVLGNDADLSPGAHEREMWVPPASQTGTAPSAVRPPSLDVDPPVDTPRATSAGLPPASVPARVTPPDPIKVEIDAEAFARVFGTMMVTFMRDGGMRHQSPIAPPPKASFWSNARHLDVFLIGTTMVIALLILAAWLV